MTSKDILLALLPPLLWGSSFTIAKSAVAQFPTLFMMLMVYTGIALVVVLTVREPVKTSWPRLFLISALVIPLQGMFVFIGLNDLSASVANLVIQTQVPFAVIIGWFAGELFSKRKFIGTILALAGVVMVIGLPEEKPPFGPVMMVITGALLWAVGQVLAAKLGRDSGIVQLKGLAIAGLPQLLAATLLFETGHIASIAEATKWEWTALVIVGVFGFYCAYAVWYTLLRRLPVDQLAPFTLLMPVFGILTARVAFGEHLSAEHLAGAAVIVGGLILIAGLGASWKGEQAAKPTAQS
jgi:O-acetylserine/cysteine efflux transporter